MRQTSTLAIFGILKLIPILHRITQASNHWLKANYETHLMSLIYGYILILFQFEFNWQVIRCWYLSI